MVGAGPTGLVLAAELALAGVYCLVLERRRGLRTDSRAICLHARTMEVLDLRGQAGVRRDRLAVRPSRWAGRRRDQLAPTDFPYLLTPQS